MSDETGCRRRLYAGTMTSSILPPSLRKQLIVGRSSLVLFCVVWTLSNTVSDGCRCGISGRMDLTENSRRRNEETRLENPFETVLQPPVHGNRHRAASGSGSSTAPSSVVDVERDENAARLDAIKADILDKLGVATESELGSTIADTFSKFLCNQSACCCILNEIT